MAGALTTTGLEVVYAPWNAAALSQQGKAVWREMQDFCEREPSDTANTCLARSALLTVNGGLCTRHILSWPVFT